MHLFLIIVLITDCVLFLLASLPAPSAWPVQPIAILALILNLVALLLTVGVIHP